MQLFEKYLFTNNYEFSAAEDLMGILSFTAPERASDLPASFNSNQQQQ